jgi:peroxiredoxin
MPIKPFVFLTLVAALVAYILASDAGTGTWVHEGGRAPAFKVRNLAGEEISLEDLAGRVVFLNFWRTDCVPCALERPDLERVAKVFAGRKFEMMAVSLDLNQDDVARFYRERSLTIPAYLDPHKKVAGKYNVRATPESFIIDSNGHVAKYYVGPHPWTSPPMLAMLVELIPE